ncbi:unnamed protein product [Psylliodes chrysocephalus]|uniref:Uncharacterized protein n=1 Tax=Psylliodes chrysocephalus TaxID=3402493 RepID=A0A9P0G2C0_9CUCU|nr:unnamed protein product [Psylliodes chrysocephala]
MKTSLTSLIFFISVYTSYCFNFANRFKVCQRNDPELDACLADAIERGFELLGSSGLPALKVPSIDPLKVNQITIGAGTNAVNLVQNYFDATISGLSKLKVKNAHFDFDKKILSFISTHTKVKQDAKYDINGKILVLPVYGKGDTTIIFDDAVLHHYIHFKEEIKNDQTYLKVIDYNGTLSVGKAHFDFQNLFNGDKVLGDNILRVINDNWMVIFEDVKEGIEKSFSQVFKAIATEFFSRITLNTLIPN